MRADEHRALLDAIARRALASIRETPAAPAAAKRIVEAFDGGATAVPAQDLYQRLRDAEHLCASSDPRLARRLGRLGRLVERVQQRREQAAGMP